MAIDDDTSATGRWWERRWFVVALVLAAAVPLLWPALPPLSDLPGHMGRWHIAMALPTSPDLQRYYAFRWALVPNLGMDLLVPALAQVVGFEPATKLAVIAIPMLTVAGLLWAAREAHGRVPGTAIFAVPLAHAWPFQFGFVNFTLSQALAFCALGLWLRLGREERFGLRALVFVPIACVLWLAHSFGWGMFGLMAAGAELARLRDRGWARALLGTALQCLPLALPMLAMAKSGTGAGLAAGDWFDLPVKAVYALSILRDRWAWFDIGALLVPVLLLYAAARSPKLGYSATLGWPALLCAAAFVLLPRLLMGGAYVDMRMAPAALMLALIAVAPAKDVALARTLALAGLAFCGVRLAGTTLSFVARSAEQQRELAAIAAIPRGAAVLSLVARPCGGAWTDLRRDQLPGMAIVRRDVFTNAQWTLEGQQLLRVRYPQAAPYLADPSQLVLPRACAVVGSNFAHAMRTFPRAAFTHVWTIGFAPVRVPGLPVAWTDGSSTLYRVVR